MTIPDFVALDFETANEKRVSACAVGITLYEGGLPSKTFSTLLKPHEDAAYFSPMNTWIHGITAADVAHSPTWPEVYPHVAELLGGRPVVAHNMAFDWFVLRDLQARYGLPEITNMRLCTMRLARRILADQLPSMRLPQVFQHYFPGTDFEHHEASADATAAGNILARMVQEHGWEQITAWCPEPRARTAVANPGLVSNQLALSELIAKYGSSTELKGQSVLFTGTLTQGKRSDLEALVTHLGAIPGKSLTAKTNMLVVGTPSTAAFTEGSSASRKLVKATQLREKGSPIEVLTEEEFFNLLSAD